MISLFFWCQFTNSLQAPPIGCLKKWRSLIQKNVHGWTRTTPTRAWSNPKKNPHVWWFLVTDSHREVRSKTTGIWRIKKSPWSIRLVRCIQLWPTKNRMKSDEIPLKIHISLPVVHIERISSLWSLQRGAKLQRCGSFTWSFWLWSHTGWLDFPCLHSEIVYPQKILYHLLHIYQYSSI